MPVTFRPPDVLQLNRYGLFTKFRLPGQTIAAANAVSLSDIMSKTADERGLPFQHTYSNTVLPTATHHIPVKLSPQEAVVVERFHWGETSRPDKVYYEIFNWGKPFLPLLQEGFHCGGPIGHADLDNRSTHPTAARELQLLVWNCTLDAGAEDIWYEVAIWYYLFQTQFLDEILDMSFANMFGNLSDKLDKLAQAVEETNRLLKIALPLALERR